MDLPAPRRPDAPVAVLIDELAALLGPDRFVALCTDLLGGADRAPYAAALRYLTGHDWAPGGPLFDRGTWPDHWVRSWGARGLLHVWHPAASDAVVAGLADEHWRPAEMCLKVSARHEVAGAGDGAAALAGHDLPRVRAHAVRALGVVGDTEHVAAVRARADDPDPEVRRQAGRALERLRQRLDL